ncbi:DUF4328 domain-containing protein [Hymenobacter oligotrophus]|nr:DUF4328 domain-containing protein [Hymenobacter oligotrophus]
MLLPNYQRYRLAVVAQWVVVVATVAALVSSGLQYRLLQHALAGIEILPAAADANDDRQQLVGGLQLVLTLLAFIGFISWFARAYDNLRRIPGAPEPAYSPGWAVGAWLVPILNLWRPLHMLKEVWYRTQRYALHHGQGAPAQDHSLLTGWWILRIVLFVFGRLVSRAGGSDPTVEQLLDATTTLLMLDVLNLAYAVLTIVLLQRFRNFEDGLAARYAPDNVPATPVSVG